MRKKRKLILCVVALALVLMPARRARADIVEDVITAVLVIGGIGGIGLGANIAFTVKDARTAYNGERLTSGWAIAQTVLTPPQALLFDGAMVWAHGSGEADDSPEMNLLLVPAIWSSQMATYGIWSLAAEESRPADMYMVSWAIGANTAFMSGAVGAAIEKRFGGVYFGLAEMIGTTPSFLMGLSALSEARRRDESAWFALSVWSGALFMHGMASTVMGFKERDAEAEEEKRKNTPTKTRAHFMLYPSLVSDGRKSVPGLMMGGVF